MVATHNPLDRFGANVEQLVIEPDEALDLACLEAAWQAVVERHEVLRARVLRDSGHGAGQQFMAQLKISWSVLDWPDLTGAEAATRWAQFLQADRATAFDLARAPLHRCQVIRFASGRQRVVWTFHHVLLDGRSIALVAADWVALYRNLRQQSATLSALPPPFHSYLEWHQGWTVSQEEAALGYWQKQLRGFRHASHPPAELVRTGTGGTDLMHDARVEVSVSERARLLALAEATGVSLGTLVQAAWALLLRAHAATEDVLFGVVRSGRHFPEAQATQMVGMFINTLPLRARFSSSTTVRALLAELRGQGLEVRPFEETPPVWLRRASEMAAGEPLYQSLIVFERYRWGEHLPRACGTPGWRYELLERPALPLTVAVRDGSTMDLRVQADGGVHGPETAVRLARHLCAALNDLPHRLDQAASRVCLLDERERHQVVVEWNATAVESALDLGVHHRFEEQAERTPEAVAVMFGAQMLTYRDLNRRASQLAQNLSAMGVAPGVLVGVCLHRSLEMVVSLLGVLKAGGAYVPLDPDYPARRLQHMVNDSRIAQVICSPDLTERLSGFDGQIIDPTRLESTEPKTQRSAPSSGEPLAYVLYTSGSTGTPKGVMVPHRALANHMAWMQRQFPLARGDRVLQKTAFSFDASVWEFYAPLLAGACLVMARPGEQLDPERLVDTLCTARITVLQLVPTLLRALLDLPRFGTCRSLARVFCGGEALEMELVRRFHRKLEADLCNLYGPTEATIDATWWRCRADEPGLFAPIGRPVDNVAVHILDEAQQPVPIGVTGELYIGGTCLAQGYWNRPELTAERFLSSLPGHENGERFYRTGDLARYRADGVIEFLGRSDHQVKVRGFRVELGEVEAALKRQEDVEDAVVFAHASPGAFPELAACLVTKPGRPLDWLAVRRLASQSLPDYMIPSRFAVLTQLPLTPNGKVDRQALEQLETIRVEASRPYEAPNSDAERELAQIWRGVLGVDRVGRGDHFFELGGHSLLAARLVNQVEERLGRRIPVSAIFQAPTLAALARLLVDARWAPRWSALVPLQPSGTRPPVFFAHGWGGSLFVFTELAWKLGAEQPSFGLQALGWDGSGRRHESVEEMAAHYVGEMLTFRPQGPFILCGYSLGGLIAFEVARQLKARGREVRLLVLMDTRPRTLPWKVFFQFHGPRVARRGWLHLKWLLTAGHSGRGAYLWARLRDGTRSLLKGQRVSRWSGEVANPAADPPPGTETERDYYATLTDRYRLRRGGFPILLFLATDAVPTLIATWRWAAHGRLTVQPVPSPHAELFTPQHLETIAATLRRHLAQAEAAAAMHQPAPGGTPAEG